MCFSVKRGRKELSKELSRLAPQLDTQNYMSLIRAAGHNKGADAPSSCYRSSKADGVGRHHTENSFGKVPGVVIEELAKNCTALTTVYVDSCGKATDAGIEALLKICTLLTTI